MPIESLLFNPWVIGAAVGLLATGLAFAAGRLLLTPAARKPEAAVSPDFVDPFSNQSPSERRIAHRRGGNPVELDLIDPDNGTPASTGYVVDRSIGGLCVDVERPIPVGKQLKVKIRSAPASVGAIAIEVKSCRAEGASWRLGCQFVKTPTFNVMLLFG